MILSLSLISQVFASSTTWEKHSINAILQHHVYLTENRYRLSPLGIEIPSSSQIDRHNQCYVRLLERFLQLQVQGKTLKVKYQSPPNLRQLNRQAYLKFDGQYDLAEFLLRQGWAKTNQQAHEHAQLYQAAQVEAQKAKRGLWGACDGWYHLREKQRLQGLTRYFPSHHRGHLASSAGWVQTVPASNVLELSDGLKVRLQGLKMPATDSPLGRCWNDYVKTELEHLVLGKKVLLEKDLSQLTLRGRQLQRYVWLPGYKWRDEMLLNEYFLQQGWAQLDEETIDKKYYTRMHTAAQQVWDADAPPAVWQQCATATRLQAVANQTAPAPTLEYDVDCPIKGNIAGSKKNPKLTYHTPLSGWYKRIAYEQCFADEAEAEAAGFTKVK